MPRLERLALAVFLLLATSASGQTPAGGGQVAALPDGGKVAAAVPHPAVTQSQRRHAPSREEVFWLQ